MALENCPKCSHELGAPLKSSGRQVCMKCGWSDKPKASHAKPSGRSPGQSLGHSLGQSGSLSYSAAETPTGTVLGLSVLCHLSVFLTPLIVFPIVIPLVLWLGCNNTTIKANAKEAFNFQIYTFVLGLLLALAVVFAFFLLPILLPIVIAYLLGSIILPVIATIQLLQNPTEVPQYPWIERFFK